MAEDKEKVIQDAIKEAQKAAEKEEKEAAKEAEKEAAEEADKKETKASEKEEKKKDKNDRKKDKTKEKIEWLKKLKNNGFTLGLVTTCMRKYLCVLIEKLNIYYLFDCIIAREDVDNIKPIGDAYLKALNI